MSVHPSTPLPELSPSELARYSRHLSLAEVGVEGQRRLKAARVLIVGAGGLGSPVALYLTAAGIGTIGLVDFDKVDETNLQRQVLYGTSDVGASKLEAASSRLRDLNPYVSLQLHPEALTANHALDVLSRYDLVIDGTDNFPARYLVNDACVLLGKPNVYGSISRFEGQASVFSAPGGPCYRCLHPEPPPPGMIPSCAEGGVLGVLPAVIGSIQATEAVKLVLGVGEPLVGRFMIYDALRMRFREIVLQRDPDCPVCGHAPTIRTLIDHEIACAIELSSAASTDGAGTMSSFPAGGAGAHDMTVEALKALIDQGADLALVDVREPHELAICCIPGAINIPLGDVVNRLSELDVDRPLVVFCRSGGRSAQAVAMLRRHGFDRVRNLNGGVLAWVDRIDPSQPKY